MLFARRAFLPLLALLTLPTLGTAATTANTMTTKTSLTPSRTTFTGTATHTIQVGPKSNPHAYIPRNITASVGDVVVFEFYPTNHSVVKADYLAPCVPASDGLFYSGIFDTFNEHGGQLVGPPPTWSIVVNDTEPTFFYCTAIGSCLENGMVGVINPDTSQTFAAQYNRALTYPYMLVPGQSMPAEGSTGSGSTPEASPSSSMPSDGGHPLSKGAIAGIAVICAALVAILAALFFVLGRNRVYRRWISSEDERTERTARWAMSSSQGDPWNQKSELDANAAKPPPEGVTLVGNADRTSRTWSSQGAGSASSAYGYSSLHQPSDYWSQEAPQSLQVNRGPAELEAHSVRHQNMSGVRDYR